MGHFTKETRTSFFALTKRIPVVRYKNIEKYYMHTVYMYMHMCATDPQGFCDQITVSPDGCNILHLVVKG